jgi:hypothetical protein
MNTPVNKWVPPLHEDTLFQCFDYFLNGVKATNKTRYKLRQRLIRHLTGLVFQTRSPLVSPLEIGDTPLRQNCHLHGSVRLFAASFNETPVAKYWLQSNPREFRREILKYLCAHWEYGYTEKPMVLCHLFSDVFEIETWFDNTNVRLAGSPGLNYEEFTAQPSLRVVYVEDQNVYLLVLNENPSMKKPKFALPRSPIDNTQIIEGKYALRLIRDRPRTNKEVCCFIPPTIDGDTAHYAFSEFSGIESATKYMIYPPEFKDESRLQIAHNLFLFTIQDDNEYRIIAKHSGTSNTDFVFELKYAYRIKALALIDAQTLCKAEKLMVISRRLHRD